MLPDPIFHDDKDGQVRFVESVWPHKTYPINYGSVPQTWENPEFKHEFTGYPGDNDPVDMFEISSLEPGHVGQVKRVKLLGGLAMVDVSGWESHEYVQGRVMTSRGLTAIGRGDGLEDDGD